MIPVMTLIFSKLFSLTFHSNGLTMKKTLIAIITISLIAACSDSSETYKKTGVQVAEVDHRTIEFDTILGETTDLNAFEGDLLLVVNVASECGFTYQYEDLEILILMHLSPYSSERSSG